MPRQPYASPVMNIRIIFICHHPFFVDFITVGANRIRPIFHWGMDMCIAFALLMYLLRIAFALYFYGEMDISIAFVPIPIGKWIYIAFHCFISVLLILYIDKILEIRRITKKRVTFVTLFTVVPPGIEPGTQGFSVLCSTN